MEMSPTDDPIEVFRYWLDEAGRSEINDPNAVALATATTDGWPSVRMVLVKHLDSRGFCFYTNAESRKGKELGQNPRAAMCFHWKSIRTQIRVEGAITELSAEDVDRYFHSRSRGSQIGAAVSHQSMPLQGRARLEELAHAYDVDHPGEIPMPRSWKGYALFPERIEFWFDGADRLHDRFLFSRVNCGWGMERLYP